MGTSRYDALLVTAIASLSPADSTVAMHTVHGRHRGPECVGMHTRWHGRKNRQEGYRNKVASTTPEFMHLPMLNTSQTLPADVLI
jgi:hypothetical protein